MVFLRNYKHLGTIQPLETFLLWASGIFGGEGVRPFLESDYIISPLSIKR